MAGGEPTRGPVMTHDWLNHFLTGVRKKAMIIYSEPPPPHELEAEQFRWRRRLASDEAYFNWCITYHRDPDTSASAVEFEEWWLETYGETEFE